MRAGHPRTDDRLSMRSERDIPGGGPRRTLTDRLEVHVSATVAMAAAVAVVLLLGKVGHERLRREDHRRDGGRVLERGARHLGSIHDAVLEHVAILALERVESLAL